MIKGRILLVEDEPDIAEILEYNLVKADFQVDVEPHGDSALETIRKNRPDLVILDHRLPGMDGLKITRVLKRDERTGKVPIIMLTAKSEEVDRIVGLELGADDYIAKPYSPREVVSRTRALLHRRETVGDVLEVGELRLDVEGRRLEVEGEEVSLSDTEFRLLELFMERCGRVQSHGQLLQEVWGYVEGIEDIHSRTVGRCVGRLRRKLGEHAELIETVVTVGYRMRRV